jgi:hypothetical protein
VVCVDLRTKRVFSYTALIDLCALNLYVLIRITFSFGRRINPSYPLLNSTGLPIVASPYTIVSRFPDFDVIFRLEARGVRRGCVWRMRKTVKETAQLSGFSLSKIYVTVECRIMRRVFP